MGTTYLQRTGSGVISLRVLTPGFQTTLQDLGRQSFAHLGISASGAADPLSLRIANLLTGNAENTPALEMTLTGSTLVFDGLPDEKPAVIALAGSDFHAQLDGMSVPMWQAFHVRPGQTLRMGGTSPGSGARCYLAIRGGFRVPELLGSASTHLLSHFGGREGRALKRGDVLQIHIPQINVPQINTQQITPSGPGGSLGRVAPEFVASISGHKIIRVTPGPQRSWFPDAALSELCGKAYTVTESSNRSGLRLSGTLITVARTEQMLTEGVSLGAIQIPPDGQPIIVFVEQQTTGGYPKIANVILADMHRVGQLRPRDHVQFEVVTLEEAVSLLQRQEEALRSAVLDPPPTA